MNKGGCNLKGSFSSIILEIHAFANCVLVLVHTYQWIFIPTVKSLGREEEMSLYSS